MGEMVKRVAEAMEAAHDEFGSMSYPDMARVAIQAMREPTEAMVKAMQESGVFDEVNGMISFCAVRGSHPGGLKGEPPMPRAYTIMVDAALT